MCERIIVFASVCHAVMGTAALQFSCDGGRLLQVQCTYIHVLHVNGCTVREEAPSIISP